jgi:hypothetical protein
VLGAVFVLFVLVAGGGAVVTAGAFALAPRERTLAILRPLSASTAFASVSGTLAGTATALKNFAEGAEAVRMAAGLAEASVAGAAGFALLAVTWLLAAVGFRRQE